MSAPRLLRAALTGGIATGKSHCLREFARLGAQVIDADDVSRALVEPGMPALDEIAARFGASILTATGGLDRAALGRVVFADPLARADLERILHPRVYAHLRAWFTDLTNDPAGSRIAIADIPLLYETGHERDFDCVIVAACPRDQQRARVMARDGLSGEQADLRIAAQWPIKEKVARADYVIETSGSVEHTDGQVANIWREMGGGRV